MRWSSALVLLAALITVPTAVAAASGTGARVTVAPKLGTPRTRFVVSFRAPDTTGRQGAVQRSYEVSVQGGSSGCNHAEGTSLPPTRKGTHVRVPFDAPSGGWCLGRYSGKVEEWLRPICGPAHPVCPQFIAIKMIGTFLFRVARARTDTSPPRFAGLKVAIECVPGPERPREQLPVHLAWAAATDNVTPSSQIVYEIFMARRSGGENYSAPNWRVRGVTHYETPSVPLGSFFVVRARDQAGNTDHNTVQRQAVSPCV